MSFRGLVAFATEAHAFLFGGDGNPMWPCSMQSTWTDLSGKGVLAMVPAMVVLPDGLLWRQNWPLGTHVNDGINILRGPAGVGIEFWWQSTVLMVHFGPTGAVTLVGVVKDDLTVTPAAYAGIRGDSHGVVIAAVNGATLFAPPGWVVLDAPPRPVCCASTDGIRPPRAGASKSDISPPRPHELPSFVPTHAPAGQRYDCKHERSFGFAFQGAMAGIFFSGSEGPFAVRESWTFRDDVGPLLLRATVGLKCLVFDYLAAIAVAHRCVVCGSGENGLRARFPGREADIAFDVRANPPQHAPHLQSFLDTVTARPVDVPLRLTLAAFAKGLARVERVSIFRGAMRGGLANVLAKIAGFVCELAHDYYEDADAPIASDLADAAKIKSMKAPDGSYVFPRAEDVGRDFALELLSMDSVRFA